MRHQFIVPSCLILISFGPVYADDGRSFELRDGDRVVFVGNTFIEREQVYGYLETMLTARWPDRNVTFRNLGWSGDTVWGEARAGFDTPAEGFKRLVEQVQSAKPTLIVIGYGLNESFAGDAGLEPFRVGLTKLVHELEQTESRIVLLSPIPQTNLAAPLPDAGEHNRNLANYSRAIQEVSDARGHRFIDLFRLLDSPMKQPSARRLTDNGVHLTDHGYWWVWTHVRREFGMPFGGPVKPVGRCGNVWLETFMESRVGDFTETPRGYRFDMIHPWLPDPQSPIDKAAAKRPTGSFVVVRNMPPGTYEVHVDKVPLKDSQFTVQPNTATLVLPLGDAPDVRQVEALREAIIQKNRLYFHRWRPQNETYLFGFRKHEQGQNAAEVPKFDPLIEELEAKIAKLRVPVKHTCELIRTATEND